MCVVSMVMDHYHDKWRPLVPPTTPPTPTPTPITGEEVEEFRRLLERAREYDRKHSQPDCETEDKREALRKIAEALGFKIDFV